MWQALKRTADRLLDSANRSLRRTRRLPAPLAGPSPSAVPYAPLQRVLLTDGVGRTLFEEYAAHRAEARGDEETGWVLLGLREADEAVVLATLPAGAEARRQRRPRPLQQRRPGRRPAGSSASPTGG